MPTGYTHKLYAGDKQSFPEFAMECARAFGALIHMRDDRMDAPIRPAEISDYNQKQLEQALAKQKWLNSLTGKECEQEARKQYGDAMEYYNKTAKERAALQTRYELMLGQVEAWKPPTKDHEGLKKFMIEQLTTSIEGDCDMRYFPVPERKTGEQWLKDQLEVVAHDIEYHTKEQKEEEERVNGRNEWVEQLKNSLR